MLNSLREIAIRRLRVIATSSLVTSKGSCLVSRALFLSQLADMGYRVSNVDSYNDDVLVSFDSDINILKEMRGGDVKYVPLFLGFPGNIPDKDTFSFSQALGFNANWYGMVSETDGTLMDDGTIVPNWLFDLGDFGANPITGRQYSSVFKGNSDECESSVHVEWIDLEFAPNKDVVERLHYWMESCLYSKSSIKTSYHSDLESCLQYFGVDNISISKISFKETKSYLAAHLWDIGKFEDAVSCADSPTDILRLMAALTDTDVSLSGDIKFPSLNRRQRRAILSVVERSANPEEDLNRHRGLWLAIGRGLHPGEYRVRFPRAAAAFKSIRNKKFVSFEGRVDGLIKSMDFNGLVSLLSERPSVFGRRLHHLLNLGTSSIEVRSTAISAAMPKGLGSSNSWKVILDGFEAVAHKIPIKNLIVLQSYFLTVEELDYRSVVNKKGNLVVLRNKKGRITKDCNEQLNKIISSAIRIQMELKDSWIGKTVCIQPEISSYVVPLSQRAATDGLMTIARGSRIPVDVSKTIRLFIYWKEDIECVDLDLSVIMFDKNMKDLGQVSYTNLSNGSIIHSGDIISAPNGAAEFIDIPVKVIKESMPNVRYISTQVYIYSGKGFSDMAECYGGWMVRDIPSRDQSSFDIKTVQNKFNISGPGKYVIPCMLDLETNEIIYMDLYREALSAPVYSVEGTVADVRIAMTGVMGMTKTRPNMFDLAMSNTIDRGATLVSNPEDADITFGVSSSATYGVQDVEKILTELI